MATAIGLSLLAAALLAIFGCAISRVAMMEQYSSWEELSFKTVLETFLTAPAGHESKATLCSNWSKFARQWDELDGSLKILLNVLLKDPSCRIYEDIGLGKGNFGSTTEKKDLIDLLTRFFKYIETKRPEHVLSSISTCLSCAGEDSYPNLLALKDKSGFTGDLMTSVLRTFIQKLSIPDKHYETCMQNVLNFASRSGNMHAFEVTIIFLRHFPFMEFYNCESLELEFFVDFVDAFIEQLSNKSIDYSEVFKHGLGERANK